MPANRNMCPYEIDSKVNEFCEATKETMSALAPKSILNSDTGINLTQTAATGFEKTHMQNDSQSEVNSLISNRFDLNAPRCIFSNFCRFNDLQRRETPGKRQQLQNHSQITCQQEELWTWSNPIHSPQGAIAKLHNQNRNLVQLNVQHLKFSWDVETCKLCKVYQKALKEVLEKHCEDHHVPKMTSLASPSTA